MRRDRIGGAGVARVAGALTNQSGEFPLRAVSVRADRSYWNVDTAWNLPTFEGNFGVVHMDGAVS